MFALNLKLLPQVRLLYGLYPIIRDFLSPGWTEVIDNLIFESCINGKLSMSRHVPIVKEKILSDPPIILSSAPGLEDEINLWNKTIETIVKVESDEQEFNKIEVP